MIQDAAGLCLREVVYLALPADDLRDLVADLGRRELQPLPHVENELNLLVRGGFGGAVPLTVRGTVAVESRRRCGHRRIDDRRLLGDPPIGPGIGNRSLRLGRSRHGGIATGDGIGDLVWRNPSTGVVSQWLMKAPVSGTDWTPASRNTLTNTGSRPVQTASFWGNTITWYQASASAYAVWTMNGGTKESTRTPAGGGPQKTLLLRRPVVS
jgi:hypothetical protein